MHEAELPEAGIRFYPPTLQRIRAMPPVTTPAKSSMLWLASFQNQVVLPTWLFQQDFAEVFGDFQRDNTKIATSALRFVSMAWEPSAMALPWMDRG